MIPMTLSEVFLLAFNLKYPSHEAFLKVKDLICIMTASLRPLTPAELFDCLNALKMEGLTQQQFDEKMKALSWLVRKRANGTLTFFHPTVRIGLFFVILRISPILYKISIKLLLHIFRCQFLSLQLNNLEKFGKAELPQEGILFCTQFPSLGIFINKKVGFQKN